MVYANQTSILSKFDGSVRVCIFLPEMNIKELAAGEFF